MLHIIFSMVSFIIINQALEIPFDRNPSILKNHHFALEIKMTSKTQESTIWINHVKYF